VWEVLLADRLAAKPARFEARMETESILYRTLWIFVLTFLAAVATLGFVVWLVMRQGRKTAPVTEGA
jgi:nitrate reductase NapE component